MDMSAFEGQSTNLVKCECHRLRIMRSLRYWINNYFSIDSSTIFGTLSP